MELPGLTLGVYRMSDRTVTQAIAQALDIGYRSIDTASYYRNESAVGEAVRSSGLPREELFVTSKLWNSDQGPRAIDALHRSLELAGLEYLDCYLLHWPVAGRFVQSWRSLQSAVDEGLVRHLGVSNFLPRHLEQLQGIGDAPYVNQVEMHPYLLQREVRRYDAQAGIRTSSWSPLGNGAVLSDPVLERIGRAHGKSSAQVALRWALQHDVHVVAKASSREHLQQNWDALSFALDDSEIAAIDALDRNLHTDWDPATEVVGPRTR